MESFRLHSGKGSGLSNGVALCLALVLGGYWLGLVGNSLGPILIVLAVPVVVLTALIWLCKLIWK